MQQIFSDEHQATLWKAIPALEELQTMWENKRNHDRYERQVYQDAIQDGLDKIRKYYTCLDDKPVYVLALGKSHPVIVVHTDKNNSTPPILQTRLHQAGVGRGRRTSQGTCCGKSECQKLA